jgi:hypothetical protein
LKSTLQGRRFDTFGQIQINSTNDLFAIPKEALQKELQSWKKCERRVACEGNYLEEDNLEYIVSINTQLLLQQSGLY